MSEAGNSFPEEPSRTTDTKVYVVDSGNGIYLNEGGLAPNIRRVVHDGVDRTDINFQTALF
jgi:hypothetical protein